MQTDAIILTAPSVLALDTLDLTDPGPDDAVVEIRTSAISTGTEKLFWSGRMPPFPGMGYPLVPGYEAVGEVVEAPAHVALKAGDTVFVPGADCYRDARGLFGAAAHRVVARADRLARIDADLGDRGALLALAATARHALAGPGDLPDLIVGHGVLGRCLARLTVAAGARPPVVWETNADRRSGAEGYEVVDPDADERRDYRAIYDATGDAGLIDTLIGRLAKGGEIVLAGFYAEPVSFAFPPAFMREARIRVAAEWTPGDLTAVRDLIETGALSLAGLITHRSRPRDADAAYRTAFEDTACLKMILDWRSA